MPIFSKSPPPNVSQPPLSLAIPPYLLLTHRELGGEGEVSVENLSIEKENILMYEMGRNGWDEIVLAKQTEVAVYLVPSHLPPPFFFSLFSSFLYFSFVSLLFKWHLQLSPSHACFFSFFFFSSFSSF